MSLGALFWTSWLVVSTVSTAGGPHSKEAGAGPGLQKWALCNPEPSDPMFSSPENPRKSVPTSGLMRIRKAGNNLDFSTCVPSAWHRLAHSRYSHGTCWNKERIQRTSSEMVHAARYLTCWIQIHNLNINFAPTQAPRLWSFILCDLAQRWHLSHCPMTASHSQDCGALWWELALLASLPMLSHAPAPNTSS